jgi:hypothetical protein
MVLEGVDEINLKQERDNCGAVVNMAMKLQIVWNAQSVYSFEEVLALVQELTFSVVTF